MSEGGWGAESTWGRQTETGVRTLHAWWHSQFFVSQTNVPGTAYWTHRASNGTQAPAAGTHFGPTQGPLSER